MTRAQRFYDAPAFVQSPTEQAPCHMVTSLKIAYEYGKTLPTAAQLRKDFGMSHAASYRWRRAIKNALGLP